jgi:hypothetical protein
VAGLPKRREGSDQVRDRQEEWEPSGALRCALEGTTLAPSAEKGRNLARLEPHVEEALSALELLERQRGLSEREKTRAGALGMLMESIRRAR